MYYLYHKHTCLYGVQIYKLFFKYQVYFFSIPKLNLRCKRSCSLYNSRKYMAISTMGTSAASSSEPVKCDRITTAPMMITAGRK